MLCYSRKATNLRTLLAGICVLLPVEIRLRPSPFPSQHLCPKHLVLEMK